MAFMGRGDFPSMGDNNLNENDEKSFYRGPYFYKRFHYYIPLDNTYVIMQMSVTFIILIVGVIAFITTYQSNIIDPIENIKKLFINGYLIIVAIFLGIMFIINGSSRNEAILRKRLTVFTILSITTMIIFFGIKLNLDKTYTRSKFEEFYLEQNSEDELSKKDLSKQKMDIGITGLSIKSEKEYYVDECVKLYGIFKIKTYSILGLHLLLNILLIYQVLKISKLQKTKERIRKEDAILFDEEQNIKF